MIQAWDYTLPQGEGVLQYVQGLKHSKVEMTSDAFASQAVACKTKVILLRLPFLSSSISDHWISSNNF